jgi:hypothetical protein
LDAQAQRQIDVAKLAEGISSFCQRIQPTLKGLNFAQRRQLVELLIDCVIVTDGHVEIRYVVPTGSAGETTAFCHLRKDYFNMHALEVMAQDPTTWAQIGHHHTEFCWAGGRCSRPGDRQIAEPIGFQRHAHAWQIAPFTVLDAQLIRSALHTTREGDHGVVGEPNDIVPVQLAAFARPIAAAEAAISQKGDSAHALE